MKKKVEKHIIQVFSLLVSKHRRLIPFTNGEKVQFSTPDVFIAPTASVVGKVNIGDKSSIWYNCVIRGDTNYIEIGNRCSIGENCVLHASGEQMTKETASPLVIADDVIIGMFKQTKKRDKEKNSLTCSLIIKNLVHFYKVAQFKQMQISNLVLLF